jgi:hypothetical protein
LKFQFSLQCIIESPFYNKEFKVVIENIYCKLQELMHNCYIGDFFIEYGRPEEMSDRGSAYKTTRIQISFALNNKQGYCLRLDLPHKGVNYVHINICDLIGDSALPIENSDCDELEILHYGIKHKLFYHYEKKYWFVSNFENILMKAEIPDDGCLWQNKNTANGKLKVQQ